MSTFGQRVGVVAPRGSLQVDSLDEETRNRIENKISAIVKVAYNGSRSYFQEDVISWIDTVLRERVAAYRPSELTKILSGVVQNSPWHTVLSTIEHFAISRSSNNTYEPSRRRSDVLTSWNTLFEEEGVGYRFYGEQLLPIVEQEQATAILNVVSNPKVAPGARAHLDAALQLLRPGEGGTIDPPRIVREAITACEAQARFVLNDEKVTLGAAAKAIAKTRNSHPAFVDGISKLYGWTSDEAGIRHASNGAPVQLTTSDAIFLLTIASAFVTWAA